MFNNCRAMRAGMVCADDIGGSNVLKPADNKDKEEEK